MLCCKLGNMSSDGYQTLLDENLCQWTEEANVGPIFPPSIEELPASGFILIGEPYAIFFPFLLAFLVKI